MRAPIITFLLTLTGEQLLANPITVSRIGWPFEDIDFDYPIQSPVNIESAAAERAILPDLKFYRLTWQNVTVRVKNTGHTVELSIPDSSVVAPFIRGGPLQSDYKLSNVHLHWGLDNFDGGEHQIDGYRYAIEGHAVHFKEEYGTIENALGKADGLAVIAFFGLISKQDNPHFTVLTNLVPYIREANSFVDVSSSRCLKWFVNLGQPKHYFTYPGSLTTPPFSENVIWIVYPNPVHISEQQVEAFRELLSEHNTEIRSNRRDIQPFNNRPLIYAE